MEPWEKLKKDGKFYIPTYCFGLDGWEQWGNEMKLKFPVQYYLKWALPGQLRYLKRCLLSDPLYYLKCRFFKRYNVIKCEYLGPTWHDSDMLMLHCCFQIFKNFIEREKPWEFFATELEIMDAYEGDVVRLEKWLEIKRLYVWWTSGTQIDIDDDVADANLKSLIELRGVLWT